MIALALSALFSGVVAVAVTRAIERFGGVTGGLLGTMPTTIVPASLGIWAASSTTADFRTAMGFVPVGMLIDAVFLWCWRAAPPSLPAWSLQRQLAAMVALSLGVWSVLATGTLLLAEGALERGVSALTLGAAALGVGVVIGAIAAAKGVPAPAGTEPVTWRALATRGVLAAAAIGVSVGLAHTGIPVLAGLSSVFPAIFLTAMVSLWAAQGAAVPAGAVGPMMLGATSVSAYALLAAVLFPLAGPAVGAASSWTLSVLLVTAPSAWWLRRPHA